MERPIALVVALGVERRALQGVLASPLHWWTEEVHAVSGQVAGQAVVLIQAGIGRERARHALQATARWFTFCGAWSLGFAGALTAQLAPGGLVCSSVVLLDDGLAGAPGHAASGQAEVRLLLSAAGMRCHDGPLLTVDAPLRTVQAKREAHRRTGAVAVDMEAAGVAEWATALGIPWLAIKAIVDGVDDPLPEFLAGCTTPAGNLRWQGVLAGLLGGGNRRHTLRRLDRAMRQAGLELRRCLDMVLQAGVALTPPERSSRI